MSKTKIKFVHDTIFFIHFLPTVRPYLCSVVVAFLIQYHFAESRFQFVVVFEFRKNILPEEYCDCVDAVTMYVIISSQKLHVCSKSLYKCDERVEYKCGTRT